MGTEVITAGIGIAGSLIGGNAKAKGYREAAAIQKEQLDFNKERYADWKAVYGVLQEDLGEFYKNLTGQSLSDREVEEIQLADQKAKEKLHQELSQRGMDASGLEAELMANQGYQSAMLKAKSRATMDERANQQKQQFLSLGLGQGNAIAGQMGQTSTNMANTAIGQGNANSSMWGNITGAAIGGVQQWDANRNTSTGG
jgi:hypothetical protein